MQKFNVRVHFSKNCTESHLTQRSLRNRSFNKQSRSARQREALKYSNELLVLDCEDCLLLVGNTDSRWSAALLGLVKLLRHFKQDCKRFQSSQCYLSDRKS